MNELQIFNNPDFGIVRVLEISGEPWFVGKDAADALNYANPWDALKRNVDEDDLGKHEVMDSMGRTQEMTVINESGLYSLIFSSKLPKAKEFKHWVTSEVLPSIRKTGAYEFSQTSLPASALGGFANTVNTLSRIMKAQRCSPTEIAIMAQSLCYQFGVAIPPGFVKENPFQLTL